MMTRHYKVAGHTFAVSSQAGFFELMGNYEPFECVGGEPLFSLTVEFGVVPEYTEEYRQEEGMHMICGCMLWLRQEATRWSSTLSW